MSTFADALVTAHNTITEAAGERIWYLPLGETEELELCAIPGKSRFMIYDQDGASFKAESKDFIVKTCQLTLNGDYLIPQRGDRITQFMGEQTCLYEVLREDGSEDVFRYCDTNHSIMRIHTKRISIESGHAFDCQFDQSLDSAGGCACPLS